MAYITYDEYLTLYGEIEQTSFARFSFEAEKVIDNHTTTLDNVKKLRVAFPEDEYSVNCIRHCMAGLIYMMNEIEKANNDRQVASISSGSESVSYVTSDTLIDNMKNNVAERNRNFAKLVKEYLSGVTDLNGVNLLFRGVYPIRM